MEEKEEKDSVVIHIHDRNSGRVVKKLRVSVEELVMCWMNFHFPCKEHNIVS